MSNQSKKDDLFYQKWVWTEWFASMDVQTMHPIAQWIWFNMLGLMWLSNERGYLTQNGKPLTLEELALLFRHLTFAEFEQYFAIIEKKGLFSVRETDGAIYSRKILSDLAKSAKLAEQGRRGGEAHWAKAGAKAGGKGVAIAKAVLSARAPGDPPIYKEEFDAALAEARALLVEGPEEGADADS
jgi:hypothetical protein